MAYKIFVTPTAQDMIKQLPPNVREKVKHRIGDLSEEPEKQGKPLLGEFTGFRSVQAAGRYRIIYQVDREQVVVLIVGAGIRKEGDKQDVYSLTRKLLRAGVIEMKVKRRPRKK